MEKNIVKESLNEWRGEFEGDTPADQGARAARRDNAMRLFKVYEGDDYGRAVRILGIFKATSEDEARELAAEKFNNKEIVTTGFYGADEISEEDLEDKKARLQSELDRLNVVNESVNEMRVVDKGMYIDEEYMEEVLTSIIHGNMGFFGGVGEEGQVRDAFEQRIMDDSELAKTLSDGLKRHIPARMMGKRLYKMMTDKGLANYGDVLENLNELLNYTQNPEYSLAFAQTMADLEEKLKGLNPSAWESFEKESGDAWQAEGVEDWQQFYAKEPMDGLMYKERLKSLLGLDESLNEGFATEEGRNLDSIARLLGYDDLHEMLGDNPGLYEVCIEWIDRTFGEQLASDNIMPDELERLGLYDAAEEARRDDSYLEED